MLYKYYHNKTSGMDEWDRHLKLFHHTRGTTARASILALYVEEIDLVPVVLCQIEEGFGTIIL